ncbi:antiviral reverse transcriptase Drt3b [Pseudomonas sp. 3-2]|uniref:antiviral reverse transcriptase Drt3b n=1 Tax=Pseudomonas sp. 3-2 TaxID=2867408 RepID=UPI001C87B685|nr:antiviral reverse transcriptase Drt3b [Pseudomonas sp. 3-2]QZD73814.1 RNA-directed DNA polymerase [Pseudomonas sp. 3-2]
MSNTLKKRKVKRGDYDRALITETIPYETPIMFSNDGLYNNIKSDISAEIFQFIISRLVKGEGKKSKFTVPYTYKIKKTATEFRTLSVIHPYSQWEMREFYKTYEQLICHYTSRSRFSIRAPKSIASSFYYKNSWENVSKYKRGGIIESDLDQYTKHSSSFFAYKGFDRLYKFYNSDQFRLLEKKFSHFWTLDVSKCFDSIYTHSIAWATKSKDNVKSKVLVSSTFGQHFDALMQRANYNETNGILIGPEISRIFAEIIFQDIDCQVEIQLKKQGKIFEIDYSITRYVDDIFIFAQDLNTASLVSEIYTERLRTYNLHSNSSKSVRYERPFYSSKSRVIREINLAVNFFCDKFLTEADGSLRLIPKEIYRKSKLSQSFIDAVKSICSENSVSYDSVSSYIISAFFERTKRLINLEEKELDTTDSNLYIDALMVIIELFYFFYSVAPSVSSSYKLSASVILISRFAETHLTQRQHTIKQALYELTLDLLTGDLAKYQTSVDNFVYLEALNIVLAISELGEDYWLPPEVLRKLLRASCSYHDLMSCLFYIKDNPTYNPLRSHICDGINSRLLDLSSIQTNTEQASLWMDAVACPFISVAKRLKWIRRLYSSFNINPPPRTVICRFLVGDENCYWFTNWHEVDLLNALERKELKQVY